MKRLLMIFAMILAMSIGHGSMSYASSQSIKQFAAEKMAEKKAAKQKEQIKAAIGAEEPKIKIKAYRGYYHFVDEYGDTVRMTIINDVYVYPPLKFKNKKQEEFYWRTVRDVRKTLPYAKLAFNTLCETYEYIQTIPNEKDREKHLKRLENDIFEQYKPVVKTMTKSQGKMLLKLINRETDQSSFNIVKAFLGSFRAGFWQTFGRFFGMNMKVKYEPEKNAEDAIIERVACLIEQGAL